MNFRHSFEPGLAQFSPVLLFELSRGALQTRPEGERAPIPRDSDTLWEPTCARDVWKLETIGKTNRLHFAEEFGKEGEWSWFLSAVVSYLGFQSAFQYFSNRQSLTHMYTHTLGSLCSEYLPWLITQKSKATEKGRWKAGEACVFSTSSVLFCPNFCSPSAVGSLPFSVANCETETYDLRSWFVICCTRQTFVIGA